MEVNVFPAPAVAEILNDMVEARLHTDIEDEAKNAENNRLHLELTSSVATPIYVVQDPVTGVRLVVQMKAEYLQPAKFAKYLGKASQKVARADGADRPKVAQR